VLLESFGVKIKNASKLGKRVKQGIFEDWTFLSQEMLQSLGL
jgi:hypothetical protein